VELGTCSTQPVVEWLASCESAFSASTVAKKLRASMRIAVRTSLLGERGDRSVKCTGPQVTVQCDTLYL